jgi:biotin transport system substrate-specific component
MTSLARPVESRPLTLGQSSTLSQILWMATFAALTAAGAQVEIARHPVPYTLQTLVVLLAGAFLGPRNGAISMLMYLGAGAIGLPVYSSMGFGVARLLGPTGGYLLAFPLAAALVGFMVRQGSSLLWTVLSMAVALLVIFISGTAQLNAVMFGNWGEAMKAGFLIFSWWDVVKLGAAAATYHEVAKRWPILPKS